MLTNRALKEIAEQEQKIARFGVKLGLEFAHSRTNEQMPVPKDNVQNISIVNQMRSKSDEFIKVLNTTYNSIINNDSYTSTTVNYAEAIKLWNEMVGLLSYKTNNEITNQTLKAILMNGEKLLKEIIYIYQKYLNEAGEKKNIIGASVAYSAYKVIYDRMRTQNFNPITYDDITGNLTKELSNDLSAIQNKKDLFLGFNPDDEGLLKNAYARFEEENGRTPSDQEKEMIKKNMLLAGTLRHAIKNPTYDDVISKGVVLEKQKEVQKYASDEEKRILEQDKRDLETKKLLLQKELNNVNKKISQVKQQATKDKWTAKALELQEQIRTIDEDISGKVKSLQGKGKRKLNNILKKQIIQQHAGGEILYNPDKQPLFF